MKVDRLTKVLLAVIAANLTFITVKDLNLIPEAQASKTKSTMLPPNMKYGLVPVNEDGTISVRLSNYEQVDVNIVGINTNDEMDVNIDEIGGGYVSHGGPIPVEVE